jgi:hypothetical protein
LHVGLQAEVLDPSYRRGLLSLCGARGRVEELETVQKPRDRERERRLRAFLASLTQDHHVLIVTLEGLVGP